ncbi:MAG: hypothetical protein P1U58_10715 [Verrucomicrobiales bacterium]|nr:hypothetical protein [Verrucomicrobiales bacterium]
MNPFTAAISITLCLALTLTSCSSARKTEKDKLADNLFGQLTAEPVLSEEKIVKLKKIADSPNSSLNDDDDMADLATGGSDEPESNKAPETEAELESIEKEDIARADPTADLVAKWKKNGLNPRSIKIGDIFSDHAGPILNKAVSLADRLDLEDWTKTVNSIAEQKGSRVPMTLSLAELNALKDQAPLGTEFPTRSVALDFRTVSQSAKKPQLEKLYELIQTTPEGLTIEDEKALAKLAGDLNKVKSRLENGEQLYVITGVTHSDEMKATYPGAPLGTRDADLIQNAVTALYPHLDNLTASSEEASVKITRDPSIYWEFEVRELKLDGEKLVIEDQALAQL